ncbi:unnamed protein product [Parascedosporium putredinis]|uniref:Uncharacterized protein n=1 Tax=Parascedosporium putredinis TaxID=1442378 RepID=A0A9P1GYH0_9PEZI|nr:unnamed protein product [Parascedosporium putredinis]CAI7990128.1 unnamed protein product [Parascedosporium putredinis]
MVEKLVSLLYSTLFNPWVAIPAVTGYALKNPDQLRVILRGREAAFLPEITASPAVRKVLYCILTGIALRLQAYLTRRALNNGVSDTYDWSKEIVVVTGGAGGIGGEVVKLASRGTKVAVIDILPLTYPKPPSVEYYKCDLTDADSLHQAAEEIRANWGDPTVLCAIAGIVRAKGILELTKRDLDLTFGVNAIAVAMCYKEFVPAMVKNNHGHVVTMASLASYLPSCKMVDYAASKSAALALHEGLQTELRHVYKAPKGLTPPLTPELVASHVVDALWSGEARHIELPWLTKLTMMPIKGSPPFWRIAMQDLVKDSMSSFGGRKVMD